MIKSIVVADVTCDKENSMPKPAANPQLAPGTTHGQILCLSKLGPATAIAT